MKAISGIYKIQSKCKPERCYIGSAKNIPHRWKTHLKDLRGVYHKNNKLQNHFNKHGEADFVFSILLGCEISYLIANEQFFIDSYKPWFNIAPKAGSMLGYRFSDSAKENLSRSHLGQKAWNKGLPQSDEQRIMNGLNKLGNKNMLGKHHSEETKKHWSKIRKGKKPSEETKSKMREAHENRDPGKEQARIDKIKISSAERRHTEESKQKMRDSWVVRRLNKISLN